MTKKYISKINKGGNNIYVKDTEAQQNISSHVGNTSNPHSVTKSQVGLSNVTNDAQVKRSEMGAASGVATLDSAGKVPTSQLPSYVDDVLEYNTKSVFPTTGEAGKIYVDKSTNTSWRWSGTTYVQIKGDLVIGTTTGTAADGSIANTHYNNTSNPHSVTKAQVGLGNVVNTGDSATPVSGGTTKFTTGGAYTELAKKVDKVSGKGLSTNDYTTNEKNKLSGIASGAEVNQNAFSNVAVGNTTISADGKTDTLTLVAGSNVTITPDATNDKVTIAATDTTYSAATTSTAGLMSADDKTKLNGIESGAQTHKAPTAAEVKSALGTGSGTSKYLREDGTWQTPPDHTYTVNNGTFAIKGAGTQVASTSANASGNSSVNIVAGSNVTITPDSTNGTITISSTDTNSWRPVSDSVSSTDSSTAASSKAVKTAYDLAATKTSNTGTVTKVTAGTGLTGGDITTTGTIALATSGVTAGTYKRVTVDAYGRVTSGDNTDADTNTAKLQVSDTTNKRINTKESTGNYIQFTGGTNKFTVGDGTNSFDVAVTPSVSYPVSSVAGKTGAVTLSSSDVGLGNVGNFKAVSTVASQGLTETEKASARANIGAGTSSFSGSYSDLSNKPTIPAAAANGTYTVKTLVGSTTTNVSDFTANQSSADDVTFVQGSNVTITPDATNRKITIAAKDTTYSAATTSAAGLMSAADKTKLNSIAVSALVVCTTSTLPATLSPNTYYNITDAVSTMTLHLPTVTDNSQVSVVAAYFTTNTGVPTVNITADSPATVSYFTGYSIEASKSYELNIMWNGTKWIVAYATIG